MTFIPCLSTGQSNNKGRGPGGPSFSGISPHVLAWNSTGDNTETFSAGTAFVVPQQGHPPFDVRVSANNIAAWACDGISRGLLDADLRLALIARGGTPLESWLPGGTVNTWLKTAYPASGMLPAEIVAFHQGEANEPDEPHAHTEAEHYGMLKTVFGNLRDCGIIHPKARILLGEVARFDGSLVNAAMQQLANEDDRYIFVSCSGLTLLSDNTHFDGQSLATFGGRYAQAYLDWFSTSTPDQISPSLTAYLAQKQRATLDLIGA